MAAAVFAGAQGVLAVSGDFKTRHADVAESVNQRGQRAVAFAGKFNRLAVAQQFGAAFHDAVFAFGFKSLELPRRVALDVFPPEHLLSIPRR